MDETDDQVGAGSTLPEKTRAKISVQSVTNFGSYVTVKAFPVGDDGIPENARFTKYTPSGSLELTITNEDLFGYFVPNRQYYLDITPAG